MKRSLHHATPAVGEAYPPTRASRNRASEEKTTFARRAGIALLFAAAAGCGDSAAGPATVSAIAIRPGTPQLLLGDSLLLTATVTDARGRSLTGRVVTWSSQDPEIVTVDARGMAYGEDVGRATVIATVDGVSGSVPVSVSPTAVASIEFGSAPVSLAIGTSAQLTATLHDADGRDLGAYYEVEWTSSDDDVVTVSGDGLATGVGPGTVTITASAGGASAEIAVSVDGAQVGAEGGTVSSADGHARVEIPAGALAVPTVITIHPATDVPPGPRVAAGSVYSLEPTGLQFAVPVRLTIEYGDAPGIDPDAEHYLALHRWSDLEWVPATTTAADPATGTVSGMLEHFSDYGAVLSELMNEIEELAAAIRRVVGDPVIQNAIDVMNLIAGLAVKSDHPLFQALVDPALEAARAAACYGYESALEQADGANIESYGAYTTQAGRVLLWKAITQKLPDQGNCSTSRDFDAVLAKLTSEFADYTIARIAAGDLPTDYPKLLEEVGLVVTLRSDAESLALPDVADRLLEQAQNPLMQRLREAAYGACRQERDHEYLGQLLRTLRLVEDPGYTPADVLRDLQLCGTDVAWSVDDDGDITDSGRLGGGDDFIFDRVSVDIWH